jgi:hypothetical protein
MLSRFGPAISEGQPCRAYDFRVISREWEAKHLWSHRLSVLDHGSEGNVTSRSGALKGAVGIFVVTVAVATRSFTRICCRWPSNKFHVNTFW